MAPTHTPPNVPTENFTFTLTDKIIDELKSGDTYACVIGGVAVAVVYEKPTGP